MDLQHLALYPKAPNSAESCQSSPFIRAFVIFEALLLHLVFDRLPSRGQKEGVR
jgi:hypothetical protein